jgi:putative inorganic carbon (hco3(-)) transporter
MASKLASKLASDLGPDVASDVGSFQARTYAEGKSTVAWRSVTGAYLALHLLLVATLPFLRIGAFKVGGLTVAATDLVFLPAALVWLLAVALRIAPLRRTSFYAPVALYLLAVLVSAALSAAPRASLGKAVAVAYLAGLAVLTVNVLDSLPRLQRVVRCWLLVSAITAAAALLGSVLFYFGLRDRQINLVLWNYGSLPAGNYPRIYGFFANGNMLCNYVIISACLTLYARRTGLIAARPAAALLIGLGITAALTISAGLGGLAVAVAVWLLCMADDRAKRLRARLALVAALGIAAAFQLATSISTTAAGLAPSSRAMAWQDALQTFLAHPLVGKGVGAEVADATWRNPSGVLEHLTEAHNVWLSVAAQEGLLGLLGFASVVVWLLWRWRHPAPGADRVLISALGAAFCGALLVQGLTGAFEDTRHLWVLMGLLAAACETPRELGT